MPHLSTPDVQLAFQGGGAKLAAMLPIADAFITAQKDGLVNIKSAAGTSAGAICAALVALQADFGKARTFLIDHGDKWVQNLIPEDLAPLIRKIDAGIQPSLLDWYVHRKPIFEILLRGRPLLRGEKLRDFFQELLRASTGDATPQIDGRDTKLTIIASNIVSSSAIQHRSGDLVGALTDSCSLPILLRSFDALATSHNVDGGLCDNLPVEGLVQDRDAPVFAIFPTDKAPPAPIRNLPRYLVALLSASISHGVSRSLQMVPTPFQIPVDSDLGLLDFRRAVELLKNDDWYEARKQEAAERIADFCESFGVISDEFDERLADVRDISHYEQTLEQITDSIAAQVDVTLGRFLVHVKCDKYVNGNALGRREPDEVTRLSHFRSKVDGLRLYRANVKLDAERIVPTIWRARNLTKGMPLRIKVLPLGVKDYRGIRAKYCLIHFLEPDKIAAGDDIEVTSSYRSIAGNDMSELNHGRSDYFGFDNPQMDVVGRAELVLIYPRLFGKLNMIAHPQKGSRRTATAISFDHNSFHVSADENIVGIAVSDLQQNEGIYSLISKM